MALWLQAFRRGWARLFRPEKPRFIDDTEPAHSFLFLPRGDRGGANEGPSRFLLGSMPPAGSIRLTKLERLGGCLRGTGKIVADVRHSSVEFRGVPDHDASIEIRSKAVAPGERKARRLLDGAKVQIRGDSLRLGNGHYRNHRDCQREFSVTCQRDRAVEVRGVYAAVRLSDIRGGADVETTRARITLLDVGPAVNARVLEGIVDWSGDQGDARLYAGWEINLNFTSPVFSGAMDARAEGPVRVLIPWGFSTAFEANVAKDAAFLCRAGIRAEIERHESGGRVVYTFGEGPPVIRLFSLGGSILVDNPQGPFEDVTEQALRKPRSPMLRAHAALDSPGRRWAGN